VRYQSMIGGPIAAAALAMALAVVSTGVAAQSTSHRRAHAATGQSQPANPPGIELGAIQVRLWYEGTGRLSENIAPPVSFDAWNTIIGEGAAAENADDALATVEILSGGHEANVPGPLIIEARDYRGRIVARRVVTNLLTSRAGRAVRGLWLQEVGCAGIIRVSARLGPMQRSVQISLPCGE
jgi:hypothetical protein